MLQPSNTGHSALTVPTSLLYHHPCERISIRTPILRSDALSETFPESWTHPERDQCILLFVFFAAKVSTPHRAYSAFFCTNPKLFLLFYFSWCAVLLTSLSFLVKDKFLEVTLSCTLNPSHRIPAAHIRHSRCTCN